MRLKRKTAGDLVLDFFVYLFLVLLALIMLIPFMNVLAKAFSEEWAVVAGKVGIIPVGFQTDTMKYVIQLKQFINAFGISVFITVAGTVCDMLVTSLAAYTLSKRYLPGIKIITMLFVFTMLFSGGMIPNYLLIKRLHLLNNLAVLILPSLVSVYNMLLVKNYFEGLPSSVEESAKLDGANNIIVLFRIVLPMSTPVLATVALFYAVAHWNNYMSPLIYISKQSLKPLQLYLRDIILEAENVSGDKSADELMNITGEGVRSATIVASIVPILVVYPFLQKYFIKGITIGSVKG